MAVLVQGVLDADDSLIVGDDSDWGVALMKVCNMSDRAIFEFQVRWCLGMVSRRAFDSRTLDAARWNEKDPRAAVEHWQSWPTTSPLRR